MSATPVYCPKCGLQSFEGARFCKRCGTNLEAVSKVLTGALDVRSHDDVQAELEVVYAREMSRALYKLLGSILTFVALMIIFRGQWWVLFTLFWVADAIKDFVHAQFIRKNISDPVAAKAALDARKDKKKHKKKHKRHAEAEPAAQIPAPPQPVYTAPAPTTGEIEKPRELDFEENPPPSVTEGTTRFLDEDAADAEARRYVPPRQDAVPRK
jgi:hypothetical protein